MSSQFSESLPQSLNAVQRLITAHPLPSVIAATALIMVLKRLNEDYRTWLSLGPGGGPHNPVGYVLAYGLELLASRDLKSSVCYESPGSSKGYLNNIPIREGSEPVISKWIFPVRQLSARASEDRVQAMNNMLADLASKQDLIFTALSILEGGHSVALFIKDKSGGEGADKPARNREIFHCHDTEGSVHATLSPSDAKLMLDRGWGLRHPLSGKLNIALSYVMIYSPRNDAEIEVMRKVAQAAIDYALECRKNGIM